MGDRLAWIEGKGTSLPHLIVYDLTSQKMSAGPSLERVVASELGVDLKRARSFQWPPGRDVTFALAGWDHTDKSVVVVATASLVEKTGTVRLSRSCWTVNVQSGYVRKIAAFGEGPPILPQQVVATEGGIAAVEPSGVMELTPGKRPHRLPLVGAVRLCSSRTGAILAVQRSGTSARLSILAFRSATPRVLLNCTSGLSLPNLGAGDLPVLRYTEAAATRSQSCPARE